jgi:hypothetical protein
LSQFSFNLNINTEIGGSDSISRQKRKETGGGLLRNLTPKALTGKKDGGGSKRDIRDKHNNTGEGGEDKILTESVRDMLIKHNLFSWDL